LATLTLPKRLGGLRKTSLRWPRICAPVSGPLGFVRIRNFGFLANRRRAALLPLCFHLLGTAQEPHADQNAACSNGLWRCPKCGGPMVVVERLTAAEIQLRSPPLLTSAA